MIYSNPWAGVQLQVISLHRALCFGSGGIFGVGFGFLARKYSYLPMALMTYFAVIGEEPGLYWRLGLLAVFGALVWAGFRLLAMHQI